MTFNRNNDTFSLYYKVLINENAANCFNKKKSHERGKGASNVCRALCLVVGEGTAAEGSGSDC